MLCSVSRHSCLVFPAHLKTIPVAIRSIEKLEKEITNLDNEYDGCQEVWTNGEAQGFFNESLLVQTCMHGSKLFYFDISLRHQTHVGSNLEPCTFAVGSWLC